MYIINTGTGTGINNKGINQAKIFSSTSGISKVPERIAISPLIRIIVWEDVYFTGRRVDMALLVLVLRTVCAFDCQLLHSY